MSSWAVPTGTDDDTWERLTREEQFAAYQAHFNSFDCSTSTETTVAEIVERSRAARPPKRAMNDQNL